MTGSKSQTDAGEKERGVFESLGDQVAMLKYSASLFHYVSATILARDDQNPFERFKRQFSNETAEHR